MRYGPNYTHVALTVTRNSVLGSIGAAHILHSSPTTVYEKNGSDLVLRVTGRGNSSVQWMAMKGSASISLQELTRRFRGSRARSVSGQLTIKSVDRTMNGTRYRYVLQHSNGRTHFASAWLVLVIAGATIYHLACHPCIYTFSIFIHSCRNPTSNTSATRIQARTGD